jgi:hypothetical protein
MKIKVLQLFAMAFVCINTTRVLAANFDYTYQTVFDSNSDNYIVGEQNITKYSEWQNPPVTYLGPAANDAQATLTMRFDFSDPTTQIFLDAGIVSFNNINDGRTDYGYASLWASTDGSSWQMLLNNDVLTGSGIIDAETVYDQDVPVSLLGGTNFWIQVRMYEHNALVNGYPAYNSWADAQFSRNDPSNPPGSGNTFELAVTTVPEPAILCQAALALAIGWRFRRRCFANQG